MSGLFLEDLSVGQSAQREWTVSEAAVAAFAEVSGDTNPLHLDEAYAAGTQFKGRVAHGMLAGGYISAVLGMQLPGPGAIYVSQSLKFRRPIRIGDRVLARATIKEIDERKGHVTLSTVCSVAGKKVVDGEAVAIVSRRGG